MANLIYSTSRRIFAHRSLIATARAFVPSRSLATTAALRADDTAHRELDVGELEGITLKIEPLQRSGESDDTMRARLRYQSRKRGILESDLLLSTFAAAYLPTMTRAQLEAYDKFMDENDWDIYYWATQPDAPPADDTSLKDEWKREPGTGEWAQTVGTFRPAYRPVPSRWKESEVLLLLRQHVKSRSATDGQAGEGMAFMPTLEETKTGKKN
ncbi:Succinate dehydrogenase assembly factor 2 mitochondrial [Ceratocystis platani]|uniref:Succinate dehydrogenase assembly factor 2, mitochondrial n=1 Tax=Ceratocystis fimbriata f. sp. platani TaxID=88771 RepID=A0A0F8BUJ7_CERFI|nr:Succinate dehydrogenase assembly factor 2 mitochondrial [Ceratocystis platani]